MKIPYKYAAVAAIALVAAGLFAACSDDADSGSDSIEVVSAVSFLDSSGFHGIDESINDTGEIPATAATVARKAQTVVILTDWPEDLDDEAVALTGIFETLAITLEADEPDMAAAGEAATQAHEALHDFSHDVWAHLQAEAGVTTGHEEEDHDE